MYLLYADDSGSPADPRQEFFVLGGVAVFERQVHWLGVELERIASRFDAVAPRSIELHGSAMLNGREGWDQFPRDDRVAAMKDVLGVLDRSMRSTVAFAVAVRKSAIPGMDPVEWAFEELCKRFDEFLKQLYLAQQRASKNHNHVSTEAQRGLMIFDESAKETSLQGLATRFRSTGHSEGLLRNITEVPLFVDSRATRLVQLADLVAFAVFRSVDRQDSRFLDLIRHRFHRIGTSEHGLFIKDS